MLKRNFKTFNSQIFSFVEHLGLSLCSVFTPILAIHKQIDYPVCFESKNVNILLLATPFLPLLLESRCKHPMNDNYRIPEFFTEQSFEILKFCANLTSIHLSKRIFYLRVALDRIVSSGKLFISREIRKLEIRILLVIAGIETNPGPVTDSIGIITVNCNGLTSDARLLQVIGRIKKKIKDVPHIIFLQESHNAI